MRKRGSEFNRNGSGRRDLARFVLMLLPGFMFLGLLAPAAVSVKPKPEERRYDAVTFRNPALRQPIQAPRPPAKREATSAVEPLFTGARYIAGAQPPIAASDLPAVEAAPHSDDQIVLAQEDAVDDYVSDVMFDQSVDSPALSVDFTPLWNPQIFDRIPATISKGGYTQYDDFHGNAVIRLGATPVPIPEPQSGALLALGLLAMAMGARATNKLR